MLCVTTRDVIIASLDSEPGVSPRKLRTIGDPCRLAYNRSLNQLVVGLEQTKLLGTLHDSRPVRRLVRPAIQLIDPDNHNFKPDSAQTMVIGPAGSRLTSLLTWTCQSESGPVDMVAIGLCGDQSALGRCDGSVIYLKINRQVIMSGVDYSIQLVHQTDFHARPVHSMVLISGDRVLIGSGNELYIHDVSRGVFVARAAYVLPSPALSLHFDSNSIYATTANHSLKMFEVQGDSGLNLVAEDSGPNETVRNAVCFTGTTDGGLLSTRSSKGGRLIGLVRQDLGELHCTFDATLPQAITRFAEEDSDQGITSHRKSYFGSAQDGTIYGFCILEHDEWSLASLVLRWVTGKKALSAARLNGTHRCRPRRNKPTDMHINGDELATFLRWGPKPLMDLVTGDVSSDYIGPGLIDQQQKVAELRRIMEALANLPVDSSVEEVVTAASNALVDMISRSCFTVPC